MGACEADEDAPKWNANQEQAKICQGPRYGDVAVLSTRNEARHHDGSRRHEEKTDDKSEQDSKLEAFGVGAKLSPTTVSFCNQFVTDFMKQKGWTNANQPNRH